jgi:hypothetical protein
MRTLRILLILNVLFQSNRGWSLTTIPDADPWMVYQVLETHSLWKFAEHLKIQKNDIPRFIKAILQDNPRLQNANLLIPGENILIRSSALKVFIPENEQFRTYWVNSAEKERQPASLQKVQYRAEGSELFSMTPGFGFARIDAEQRGTGARATLLSTFSLSLLSEYAWKNKWGPGSLSLNINWSEFNENIGNQIGRNQTVAFDFEYIQGLDLSPTWSLFLQLGLYQSPFLFTDNNNQVFLKVGTQPGFSVAGQKSIPAWRLSLKAQLSYFTAGFAGDTLIDQGLGYSISAHKTLKIWGIKPIVSLEASQRQLLSEVTSQQSTDIRLGASFSF